MALGFAAKSSGDSSVALGNAADSAGETSFAGGYLCNHPRNVDAYDRLLDGLFEPRTSTVLNKEPVC